LSIDQIIFTKKLFGKILNSLKPIVRIKTGVYSNLVHEAFILSLLGIKASHSAKLWNKINQLVISVLLNNKEWLVDISDLDVVVLLIVFKKSLIRVFDTILWRLLDINSMNSVDSVVSIVSKNRSSNDFFLEKLFDVDSLSSVFATFSGLVEELFHLVIYGIISKDSAGEVNEHLNFGSFIHVNGSFITRPDVEGRLTNLMLEFL
jgi:hypothetical protein